MLTLGGPLQRLPVDDPEQELLADLERIEAERKSGGRGDRGQKLRRLEVAREMWSRQTPDDEIVQRIARAFGCAVRTAYDDLVVVKRTARNALRASAGDVLTQIDAGLATHTARAFAEGNLKEARAGMVARGKLHGVFAPERTEHVSVNVKVQVSIDATLDHIDDPKILEALVSVLEAFERSVPKAIDKARAIDVPSTPLTSNA